MDRVILKNHKDKKKKYQTRVEHPFKTDQDYQGNSIQNMDNQDINQYHDYERQFEVKPGSRKNDRVIINDAIR